MRNENTNRNIRREHLRIATPDVVYAALVDYGKNVTQLMYVDFAGPDTELENALARRDERLINLGLAQFAFGRGVLTDLYGRARTGSGDLGYDKAIRLAVLSNRVAHSDFSLYLASLDESEVGRLAQDGDDDELIALLTDAAPRSTLAQIYKREGPFANLEDERWRVLVQYSRSNLWLNVDRDSESGPDFDRRTLHVAIWEMLRMAPITSIIGKTLYALLCELDPAIVATPSDIGQVHEVLKRWRGLHVGTSSEDRTMGYFTLLTRIDEFLCLISTLYGRAYQNGEYVMAGDLSADDQVLRCAHYGRQRMTVKEMEAAHERDKDVFEFSAVLNEELYLDAKTRAVLEGYVTHRTRWLYNKRCKELAGKYAWFLLDSESDEPVDETPESRAEATRARLLAEKVAGIDANISTLTNVVIWGLCGLAAVMWFFKH